MSDIIEGAEDLIEGASDAAESAGDAIGLTSDEASNEDKKSFLSSLTIFDSMLMLALLFVTLATLVLFFELRNFGPFPFDFPWRTNEFLSQ